jgi:hypothetical protein
VDCVYAQEVGVNEISGYWMTATSDVRAILPFPAAVVTVMIAGIWVAVAIR